MAGAARRASTTACTSASSGDLAQNFHSLLVTLSLQVRGYALAAHTKRITVRRQPISLACGGKHLELASDRRLGSPIACTGSASSAASSAGARWPCPAPSGPHTRARACVACPTEAPAPTRRPPEAAGPARWHHWQLHCGRPEREVLEFQQRQHSRRLFLTSNSYRMQQKVPTRTSFSSWCTCCAGGLHQRSRREGLPQGCQRLLQLRLQARRHQRRQQPANESRTELRWSFCPEIAL